MISNTHDCLSRVSEHLGYELETQPADYQCNRRNGTTRKTLKGDDGALPIDVLRDRDGSFEPELINKGQTRIKVLVCVEICDT